MNDTKPSNVIGCKLENCPVNQGGKCSRDIEHIEDCDQAILSEPKLSKSQEEFRSVNPGLGLSLNEVATILQDRKVPTVCIVGAWDSGKTTFLAMLFHRFLRSHEGFNGHLFMDSESFLALNQRLHYAVIKSKRLTVQMPRTSLDEEPAFHFKTKDTSGVVHECLWIDIPGEAMESRLSKAAEGWGEFRGLARTSHVILFLDLKVISEPEKRGPHVAQSLDALTYSIQSKTWCDRKLLIAFSKADAYATELKDQIINIQSKIQRQFKDDFKSIDFCELHSLGEEPNSGESLSKIWKWVHD